MCIHCPPDRTPPGPVLGRRALLVGSAAAATAAFVPARPVAAGPAGLGHRWQPGELGIELLWLGVSGWQVTIGDHRLLIDPYLSRFEYRTPQGAIDPEAPLTTDVRIIERTIAEHLRVPPDFILLTHGHWDHIADVPHLLNRSDPSGWTGRRWADARIRTISTETCWHLVRSMGVERSRLDDWIVVRGGERLRFPPGPEAEAPQFTIRVIRSVHSQFGSYGYFAPGTRVEPPPRPSTISDLVDGETLGFQVEVPGRARILFISGTANIVDAEIAGTDPDVVVVGMSGYSAVDAYTERVLRGAGGPAVVVPAHHDDLVTPLDSPALAASVDHGAAEALRDTAERLRMRTTVVEPAHLEPIRL